MNGSQSHPGQQIFRRALSDSGSHELSNTAHGDFSQPFSAAGSASTLGLSSTLASFNHPHNNTGDLIGKADHKALILSGNTAYLTLVVEVGGLRSQVEAVK